MEVLTVNARLTCDHVGVVGLAPSQTFVTIGGAPVLVDNDPENRPIAGCPNVGPTIKPCTSTLKAKTGYSHFVKVSGHGVCLPTVTGITDGTPPGIVNYSVKTPGQGFVHVIGE